MSFTAVLLCWPSDTNFHISWDQWTSVLQRSTRLEYKRSLSCWFHFKSGLGVYIENSTLKLLLSELRGIRQDASPRPYLSIHFGPDWCTFCISGQACMNSGYQGPECVRRQWNICFYTPSLLLQYFMSLHFGVLTCQGHVLGVQMYELWHIYEYCEY